MSFMGLRLLLLLNTGLQGVLAYPLDLISLCITGISSRRAYILAKFSLSWFNISALGGA